MTSQVALVEIDKDAKQAFKQALNLIGGIDDLNTKDRSIVIKVGVFDPKAAHHTTVDVTNAIIDGFDKAKTIYLTESDNYRGTGTKRLQIWKQLFSKHVIPFNLSEDTNIKQVKIADENIGLSHILFKPNTLVSTHILRTYDKGSVIKNLFGLNPDKKKAKYHKKLESTILDIYEAVGGIDLAVLDGTYANLSVTSDSKRIESNVLVIGRDAVAVEAVGFAILGINPLKIPLIQEAVKRGLGEGGMSKIEVLGCSAETVKEKIASLLKEARAHVD
ncbi:MAG: DUF362 domain-containing protein [Candidatus Bathyarchaeota archaeon]|nr:DUF362 domain-containing protein [Candidatus Bathyarchaeota archaeon]